MTPASFAGLPAARAGDRFGAAVAYASVPNGSVTFTDECHDLAIGVPGSQRGRGSVVLVRGAATGLLRTGAIQLTGRNKGKHFGAAIVAEGAYVFVGAPDDRFGAALCSGSEPGSVLVVGVPDEAVGHRARAGEVQVFYTRSSSRPLYKHLRTVTQNTAGVPGRVETGDRFGASVATTVWQTCGGGQDTGTPIAVGAPGEDVGPVRDAGSVTLASAGRPRTVQAAACSHAWTQGRGGLGGTLEAGDHAEASVSPAEPGYDDDFNEGAHSAPGFVVGAPGEGFGPATDTGLAVLLRPWPTTKQIGFRSAVRLRSGDRLGAGRTPVAAVTRDPVVAVRSARPASVEVGATCGAVDSWGPSRARWARSASGDREVGFEGVLGAVEAVIGA